VSLWKRQEAQALLFLRAGKEREDTSRRCTGPTFRALETQYRATQSGDGSKYGVGQPHEIENLPVELAELRLEELDLTTGFE